MKQGRALAKTDPAGAIAAFEKALVAIPDEPRTLSEIGWVAFQKKDLKRAEESTRASIVHATSPQVKAASLYNLGRIHEEKGEKPVAIVAYVQSLKLRSNRIVRERLVKLDPGAAARTDPYKPQPVDGYVSLAAFSKSVIDEKELTGWTKLPATYDLAAPWKAVRFLTTREDEYEIACHMALQTDAGWFVIRGVVDCYETAGNFLVVEDVKVAGGVLMVRTTNWWEERETFTDTIDGEELTGHSYWLSCEERLVVCGVAAGNKPSCTPPIQTGDGVDCDEGTLEPVEKVHWAWHVEPKIDGQKLTLEVTQRSILMPADLPGEHVLAF
jgi:tetratricopeptide (TPR) repeat protein